MKNSKETPVATENSVVEEKTGKKAKAAKTANAKEDTTTKEATTTYVGLIKKAGKTLINPTEIFVNFDDKSLGSNPRKDYGAKGTKDKPGEWDLFKDSILKNGVLQSVKIFKGNDGIYALRHGFRRMKAVKELIAEGNEIRLIPVDEVYNNEEQGLEEHFSMNNGKPLTDVERAEGLRRYKIITGNDNIRDIARKLNLEYVKAYNLNQFIETAHTKLVKAVVDGEVTFSVAKSIAKAASSQTEQMELLKSGRSEIKGSGKKKIRTHHIKGLSKQTPKHSIENLTEILTKAQSNIELDTDFINRTLNLINMLNSDDEHEINNIFSLNYETAQ